MARIPAHTDDLIKNTGLRSELNACNEDLACVRTSDVTSDSSAVQILSESYAREGGVSVILKGGV